MTTLVLARPAPSAFKSMVFGVPPAASAFARILSNPVLDSLGDDALTLTMNMEALDGALDYVARDRSARAAVHTIRQRLQEMQDVANAFFDVLTVLSRSAAAPLLVNDAPLTDYLRGVVAWWSGNLRALEQLCEELRSLSADWVLLRRRIDEASCFLFPELVHAARAELARAAHVRCDFALAEAADDLELLFTTTEWLAVGLQLRFG
jgi:hypothetical protein